MSPNIFMCFRFQVFLKSCAMYLRESCDRQIIISFLSFYFPCMFDYSRTPVRCQYFYRTSVRLCSNIINLSVQ
nr:MAG TPA: hypothetical protein [Caudoviricetes sp.]